MKDRERERETHFKFSLKQSNYLLYEDYAIQSKVDWILSCQKICLITY